MDKVVFWPAHAVADAIHRRDISSAEVLEEHLSQVSKFNPALNAIVSLDIERARAKARKADAALRRGEVWGPLHGVPLTIKDAFATEGLRTTFGHRLMSRHVPRRDATVVSRLLGAGAVLFGKTNVPEVSFDWQTNSPIFGRTNNPWNLSYTPGGSSGGAAAAIAAGMSPLDIGSDAVGSIRIPAHFCGVFGFKPTLQRVSGAGHMEISPGYPRGSRHVASYGPLARTVQDLRLVMSIVAGPDNVQQEVPPVELRRAPPRSLRECRFAWTDDFGGVPVTVETRAALNALAERLKANGCHVERAAPVGFDYDSAMETFGEIMGAEGGVQTSALLLFLSRLSFRLLFGGSPWTRGVVRGQKLSLRRYAAALTRRDAFITQMEEFLSGWDGWLCPVASVPAFTHRWKGRRLSVGEERLSYSVALGSYVTVFNLTGCPAVVLPVERPVNGLPMGVQLVGGRWKDMELLDTAELLTEVTGEFQRPPSY